MTTRVVNIRLGDEYDVYIGRSGKGQDGTFGNPYSLRQYDRAQVLVMYAQYLEERLNQDEEFRRKVLELRGKRLGCFCRPRNGFQGAIRCHGQILAAFLEGCKPGDID